MTDLSFLPVVQLIELLDNADVPASMDPADLNLPGAWVAIDRIIPANMAGSHRLDVSVYLIHGDTDYRRAMDGLATLFNKVDTVIAPDGPITPQGVVLPGDPTPLPALRVPVQLYDNSGG